MYWVLLALSHCFWVLFQSLFCPLYCFEFGNLGFQWLKKPYPYLLLFQDSFRFSNIQQHNDLKSYLMPFFYSRQIQISNHYELLPIYWFRQSRFLNLLILFQLHWYYWNNPILYALSLFLKLLIISKNYLKKNLYFLHLMKKKYANVLKLLILTIFRI